MKPSRMMSASVRLFLLSLVISTAGAEASNGREELLFSFTGDLMAHSINYGMDDYTPVYSHIQDIFLADDLTFTNAEFPMDPEKPMASFPSFNIHPGYVEAFIDAGLDVVSLANNHIADIGKASLVATYTTAVDLASTEEESSGRRIYFSGITDEPGVEYRITKIVKNGWKIGFLAITQKSNAPADPLLLYQVDYKKSEQRESFLTWLSGKTPEYDLFILSYHGGVEYNFIPAVDKKSFFNSLLNAGVDIVWGHHPHVLQEIEIVEFEDRQGIILYSMGNFLSGQGRIIDEILPEEEWSYTGDSAVIQIRIGPMNDRTAVLDVVPIPIANYITPNRDVIIYPLEDLLMHPLPAPWDEFYRERSRLMSGFFNLNIKRRSSQESVNSPAEG